ncbi:MAG: asparagine synthase (glutamine-hydrolyzing), partial [Candidatus Levybacteria bacterium]|nr:asparagine synthase (glutamine-hydrolyzing) [Candidatus Levybacteria bacterium]
MCGIYGQVNKNKNKSVDKGLFVESLNTLEKRGPDSSGTYFEENIGLGHRRLSIVDLSERGNQPMFSEDGEIGIVFNGEIYNYIDIKEELGNKYQWKSRSDTEVLINAYREWGQRGLLERLEGMFVFALYDKRNNIINFARDHFGKKPLYYYLDDETFFFASELKAIINNPEVKRKVQVDKLSLSKFLFYGYVPSPNSIFDKIKKLEPSTTFQFDIKNWKIVNKYQYWNLENVDLNTGLEEEQILDKTEDLIKKATKKRLMSDVPLGIFLSGGVDSSLIAAYLSQFSKDTNSFTVCYKGHSTADESVYAERVAKKLGIKYNLCYFEDRMVEESFLEMMNYLDEPLADAAVIPLYFISKFAKN